MSSWVGQCVAGLAIATCAIGCQHPGGGGRQALLDFSQPPRLFNGAGRNAFAGNDQPGASLFNPNWQAPGGADPQLFNQLADQVRDLNQRLSGFNADNQQLVVELANAKQKLQAANEYNYQLKQQVTDSVAQLQMMQQEKQRLEQQLAALPTGGVAAQPASGTSVPPAQPLGGATLRGNNSLLQKLTRISLPGATPRMDGDVIRIEIPTDPLFVPGTYQIHAGSAALLDQLAATIQREFPNQIIGIEGHWDGSALQPNQVTAPQLTATQSLTVQQYLVGRGLPERQLFAMALGNSRPRHTAGGPPGLSPNRRIEIVVYPEFFE